MADAYVDLWVSPVWTYETSGEAVWTRKIRLDLFAGDVGGTLNPLTGSGTVSGEEFKINPHPFYYQQYYLYYQAILDGQNPYGLGWGGLEPFNSNEHQAIWRLDPGTTVDLRGGGAYENTANRYGDFPSIHSYVWAYEMSRESQNDFYDIPARRHHTIGSEDYTGDKFGTYTPSTNVYSDGVSASGTAEEWFEDFQICENALKSCISTNGRYPLSPSVVATFGSYNANTNTYVTGGNAALSATGWYLEYAQCATALSSAMSEIQRLKADLFIAQQAGAGTGGSDNQPQATAAPEIQIQTVNQPVPPPLERTEDVADDPLGELPDFVELVFEPRAEIPQIVQSDDISDLGLLRRTRFAQPTDDVAAFSEFTYNTTTFSPRETVSPAFQSGDDGVFEGIEFESERRRRDATGQ